MEVVDEGVVGAVVLRAGEELNDDAVSGEEVVEAVRNPADVVFA